MNKVSVIIPCRNEQSFIKVVLDNIIEQTYPREMIEVIVADGMSDDKTREIVEEFCNEFNFIKLIDNPRKIVPFALNAAIKISNGDIIIRMDSHCIYPADYISELVKALHEFNADNVGGVWQNLTSVDTKVAKAIALATASPFGIGNASYRLGTSHPVEVDTVPFGCYKRNIFEKIGYFDEELTRNQDDELNFRIRKSGGKIILVPHVKIGYYSRPDYSSLFKQYFQYGYWKVYVNKKHTTITTVRQLMPALFVAGLYFGIIAVIFFPFLLKLLAVYFGAYLLSALVFALKISKNLQQVITVLIAFFTLHISYGMGYIEGFVKFILLGRIAVHQR